MTVSHIKNFGCTVLLLSALVTLGCHGKTAAGPTPAPPPPVTAQPPAPAPTITLRAQPSSIDRGGSTTLQWEARNAATVSITPELGNVALTGNRAVRPASSVSYTATATGPGGTASDTARVTVNIPATDQPDEPRRPTVNTTGLDAQFRDNVKDIHFEYDKADIEPQYVAVLQGNANWLKANPNVRFTVEGHCDERGSEEYNLGLGDRRANAVKEFLIAQGVAANRLNTVSYGEEKPLCREQTEMCFEMNRRAHFAMAQ